MSGLVVPPFELAMAKDPGYSESTTVKQLDKAIAYWTAHPNDLNAATALTMLNAERTRVQSPPTNTIHIVYPV